MRGVWDLHGLKGYRQLQVLSVASTVVGATGLWLSLQIAASGAGGALVGLGVLCVAFAYLGKATERTLSAEIQRLDTILWIITDYMRRYALAAVLTTTAIAVSVLLVSGSAVAARVPRIFASAPVVVGWLIIVATEATAGILAVSIERKDRRLARRLLGTVEGTGLERVRLSLENFLAPGQVNPAPALRGIGLSPLPGQRPFYDASEFPFVRLLEENYLVVRRELLALLEQENSGFSDYGYGSVSGAGWETFHFHNGSERIQKNTDRCPETTRLIESIPGFYCRHSVFSLLRAGSSAAPHRDYSNVSLNCHLGLIVPAQGTGIRLGAETRSWQEGKCLVFDTAYEHEVWNHSSELRVVLQISFFRPELTDAERTWWARNVLKQPAGI